MYYSRVLFSFSDRFLVWCPRSSETNCRKRKVFICDQIQHTCGVLVVGEQSRCPSTFNKMDMVLTCGVLAIGEQSICPSTFNKMDMVLACLFGAFFSKMFATIDTDRRVDFLELIHPFGAGRLLGFNGK